MFSENPRAVKLCEVGPRDGLQNEPARVPTADKIRYINMLSKSGLAMIEAGSFVHPQAIPALADAEDVFSSIERHPGVTYLGLVPNARGFERAIASNVQAIAVFTAASETFTQKNIHMSIDESLATFAPIIREARSRGVFIRAYVSMAFGCPFEGDISFDRVLTISESLCELGIDELSIGDTIGRAIPDTVRTLTDILESHLPIERLAMHFHDTYGRAVENVAAAYDMGVRIFDSASGGLGGCPYAPGAGGNVATEHLLKYFSEQNIPTHVNLEDIQKATAYIRQALHVSGHN